MSTEAAGPRRTARTALHRTARGSWPHSRGSRRRPRSRRLGAHPARMAATTTTVVVAPWSPSLNPSAAPMIVRHSRLCMLQLVAITNPIAARLTATQPRMSAHSAKRTLLTKLLTNPAALASTKALRTGRMPAPMLDLAAQTGTSRTAPDCLDSPPSNLGSGSETTWRFESSRPHWSS